MSPLQALRVALCGLLIVAAACSPSSDEQQAARQQALTADFSPAFTAATTGYQQRMAEIQDQGRDALAAGDQTQVIEVYKALRDASDEAAGEFEVIEPPAAVVAQHRSLVDNLRRQRDSLNDVIDAAGRKSDDDLTTALTTLSALLAEFTTIHQAIDQELAQGP